MDADGVHAHGVGCRDIDRSQSENVGSLVRLPKDVISGGDRRTRDASPQFGMG